MFHLLFGGGGMGEMKQSKTKLSSHHFDLIFFFFDLILYISGICALLILGGLFNVDRHLCRTLLVVTSPNLSCIEKTLHSLSAIEDSRWAIYFCYNQDQV